MNSNVSSISWYSTAVQALSHYIRRLAEPVFFRVIQLLRPQTLEYDEGFPFGFALTCSLALGTFEELGRYPAVKSYLSAIRLKINT